jgi:choline dehydrogenase-like flavoprotein
VKARKGVILSAGTIGTQILHLSGIGNADDLKALKIPVLINNPAVGAKLWKILQDSLSISTLLKLEAEYPYISNRSSRAFSVKSRQLS